MARWKGRACRGRGRATLHLVARAWVKHHREERKLRIQAGVECACKPSSMRGRSVAAPSLRLPASLEARRPSCRGSAVERASGLRSLYFAIGCKRARGLRSLSRSLRPTPIPCGANTPHRRAFVEAESVRTFESQRAILRAQALTKHSVWLLNCSHMLGDACRVLPRRKSRIHGVALPGFR